MKKTMIALTMILAAGLTVSMNELNAAPAAAEGKLTAPAQELVIKGKKPARFNHAKHTALGLACGVCHHDAKHQPLSETAIAGQAKPDGLRCAACHTASFANEKLRRPMDVFHARCKTCHAEGINGKKGPTGCAACHAPAATATEQKAVPAVTTPAASVVKKPKAIEGC